jgi:competence protein ComEC
MSYINKVSSYSIAILREMDYSIQKRWLFVFLIVLTVFVSGGVYYALLHTIQKTPHLTVSFLNIGQGDAVLIQGPTGEKMLVDGGPDRSVLRELSKRLWPWDRHIDVLVETHPDKDHITGLGYVLERYRVGYFLESGIPDKTATSLHVKDDVQKEKGIQHITIKRGMRLDLGGGAYADVLFPDTDQSQQVVTNDGSVVLHVVYGKTSFMLTGDLPSPYEDHLVMIDGASLHSDVLKAGHHGSRYSTDSIWLSAVAPEYVVISAGKGNSYGHPHKEVLDRVEKQGAELVSTIDSGTITFESDGVSVVRK